MKLTDLLTEVGRPVAYYPSMARVVGSVTAGVFLCQFIYWQGKQKDPDGWIYKTQAEIEEETGLGRYEQETARKKLRKQGLLQEKKKGIPRKLYYRLDLDALNQLWNEANGRGKKAETIENSIMRKPNIIACGIPADTDVGIPQAIYTETTTQKLRTETTEERTSGTSPASRAPGFGTGKREPREDIGSTAQIPVPEPGNRKPEPGQEQRKTPVASDKQGRGGLANDQHPAGERSSAAPPKLAWKPGTPLAYDHQGWLILPQNVAPEYRAQAGRARAVAVRETQLWLAEQFEDHDIEVFQDEEDGQWYVNHKEADYSETLDEAFGQGGSLPLRKLRDMAIANEVIWQDEYNNYLDEAFFQAMEAQTALEAA